MCMHMHFKCTVYVNLYTFNNCNKKRKVRFISSLVKIRRVLCNKFHIAIKVGDITKMFNPLFLAKTVCFQE